MSDKTRREVLEMAASVSLSGYQIIDPHVHVWKLSHAFPFAASEKVPDFDATPDDPLPIRQ